MEEPKFPMRINKYLAWKKHTTRRGADKLIEKKCVFINGVVAVLGDQVLKTDTVEVREKTKATYHYLAYNKPEGVITHSPQEGEDDIRAATGRNDVFPIGRLDKASEGLIILTNDGRITDRLLNPLHTHEKEYEVTVREPLRSDFKNSMEKGVNIGNYVTKPCTVTIMGRRQFSIILTEGKKHQIRLMAEKLSHTVTNLKRTRVMNIRLGNLSPGSYRAIEGTELKTFLKLMEL